MVVNGDFASRFIKDSIAAIGGVMFGSLWISELYEATMSNDVGGDDASTGLGVLGGVESDAGVGGEVSKTYNRFNALLRVEFHEARLFSRCHGLCVPGKCTLGILSHDEEIFSARGYTYPKPWSRTSTVIRTMLMSF